MNVRCTNPNIKIMFQVPERYEGEILLLFNDSSGIVVDESLDVINIIVPTNGVVRIKNSYNSKIYTSINKKFRNSSNIEYVIPMDEKAFTPHQFYAFSERMGELTSDFKNIERRFYSVIVCKGANKEKEFNKREKRNYSELIE